MLGFKKISMLIIVALIVKSCKSHNYKSVLNDVLQSQNYPGEIESLILYALGIIAFFFVIGYFGNKKKK
tara:strand:- start:996 stop:1202 length:207 start_codon:yes stop_codon:yes gene_type:complete